MDPLTLALLTAAIGAGGSALGGFLGRDQGKETAVQGQQRMTIDDILAGMKGEGPFASLFAADEDAFQKSFVDPAKARFSNQRAPQIQQEFIQSGQQRGTGLEDTLSRAGVDLDLELASQYGQFQESALARQMQALGLTLGSGAGASPGQSGASAAGQGFAGFTGSSGFGNSLNAILDAFSNRGAGSNALASGGSVSPISRGAGASTRRGVIQ